MLLNDSNEVQNETENGQNSEQDSLPGDNAIAEADQKIALEEGRTDKWVQTL